MRQQDGDGRRHRVPGQAGEALGLDGGERVKLARVADEQGLAEQAGHAQQQVRAHLVGLIDDRPRPRVIRDLGHGPLMRGGQHDVAAVEVGQVLRGAHALVPPHALGHHVVPRGEPPDQHVPLAVIAGIESGTGGIQRSAHLAVINRSDR